MKKLNLEVQVNADVVAEILDHVMRAIEAGALSREAFIRWATDRNGYQLLTIAQMCEVVSLIDVQGLSMREAMRHVVRGAHLPNPRRSYLTAPWGFINHWRAGRYGPHA